MHSSVSTILWLVLLRIEMSSSASLPSQQGWRCLYNALRLASKSFRRSTKCAQHTQTKDSMDQIPFPETHELNNQLQIHHSSAPIELRCINNNCTTLPGQPRVRLVKAELNHYLRKDLSLPELNQLAPWLWLV